MTQVEEVAMAAYPHGATSDGITWTATTSDGTGTFQAHDPVPDLQQKIVALEKQIDLLVKQNAEKEDIEYFRRNMLKNLKVPPEFSLGWEIDDLHVGPNDILVVNIRTTDVPQSKIEAFLRRSKQTLGPLLDARGLKDRHLWVAGDTTGFSVIHIETREDRKYKEMIDYANATRTFTPGKKKFPPPVMG